MFQRIRRWSESIGSFALTTSLATTAEIPYANAASGTIFLPSGLTMASMTFYGAPWNGVDEPGRLGNPPLAANQYTYLALQDNTGAAVVLTVAVSKCYPFPDACFGCRGIKIVVDVAGSVDISLKG
jgi:hypothetical protein